MCACAGVDESEAGGTPTPPGFERWKPLPADEKNRLCRDIAIEVRLLSAYKRALTDGLDKREITVEHVLPQAMVLGSLPGAAEDDPFGWTWATASANSSRGSKPLVLWSDKGIPDGHYNPSEEVKPFLARIWLYLRATYAGGEHAGSLSAPSAPQRANRKAIFEMAKGDLTPPQQEWHDVLCEVIKQDAPHREWRNPLFGTKDEVASWLGDEEWQELTLSSQAVPHKR